MHIPMILGPKVTDLVDSKKNSIFGKKRLQTKLLGQKPACHRQFNLTHPKTIARENDYRKREIRETLEIKKAKYNKKNPESKQIKATQLKLETWKPLLANINQM